MSEPTPAQGQQGQQGQGQAGQGDAGQGDAGQPEFKPPASQQELDRLIGERLARQKAQFASFDEYKAKAAQFDQLEESKKSELQKAQDELTRWQGEAEKWRSSSVAATVKALAATDFADPDDAVRNLDPAKYLDAGGTIDEKAIQADLGALLDAKPHYRREQAPQGPRPPRPNPAQGTSGTPAAADPAQEFASILAGSLRRS